jgi:hypothetical protein
VSERIDDFTLRRLDDATDRARLAPNTELALVAICEALGWVSMALRSLHTPPQGETAGLFTEEGYRRGRAAFDKAHTPLQEETDQHGR